MSNSADSGFIQRGLYPARLERVGHPDTRA